MVMGLAQGHVEVNGTTRTRPHFPDSWSTALAPPSRGVEPLVTAKCAALLLNRLSRSFLQSCGQREVGVGSGGSRALGGEPFQRCRMSSLVLRGLWAGTGI